MRDEKWKKIVERKARWGTRRTYIRRMRLIQLSGEQNHRCCYCGQDTWHPEILDDGPHFAKRRATLEHVVAQVDGGGEGKHNLVMACSQCNSARGEKPIEYFVSQITCGREVPISRAYARYLKKEKKQKSEKGQIKLGKTLWLCYLALIFTPDLFLTVSEELKHKPKTKEARDPRKALAAIRRRVVSNNMVYRVEAMAHLL